MAESDVLRRRIPDDEVYRPIFEAEVNLVESLERQVHPITPKSPVLPLVRESRSVTGHGILTRRQKAWTDGRPNEGIIENPVHYKYTSVETQCHTVQPNDAEATREVRGLPNTPEVPKEKSDIIERLQASRKERHESTLEDMYQEFGVINVELEPQIIEASESLKDLLLGNDKEVDRLLSSVASDEVLLDYSLQELHSLWGRIAEQSVIRQLWIADLDQALRKVEQDRSNMICGVLKSYDKTLERIAHLMPPDVHRLLEREAQQVNATVLLNLRAYADLTARLYTADVERERRCHVAWQNRVEDWRQLKVHVAIAKFNDLMASPFIRDPPEVRRQLELFIMEQSALNRKRLELLSSLSNMKPPNSTKSAVYQWHAALTDLFEQLEEVHTRYKEILQAEYDAVVQQCVEHVQRFKEALLDEGVLDAVRIEEVMNEAFLPLVGEKKTKYEYEMDKMERSLDNLLSWQEMMVKSLFKFVQGAAHLWDLHEIGLARQERSLQEKLEKNRQDHDGNNQVKEANLDIIMDKMRQDSSEQALKHSLQQALDLLGQIQEMYKEFHKLQVDTTQGYPELVQDELTKYDTEICNYLQVGRTKPAKAAEPQVALRADQAKAKRNAKSSAPQSLDDVLKTSNGTTFYILVEPGEHGLPDSPESVKSMKTCVTFLTDNLEDDDDVLPSYLEAIGISDEIFMHLRKNLRLEFLEHLEEWKTQALDKADSVVSAKLEELNSELDLRLHLHEPRASRAEQDVHHVRAAELIMHRERVERHCKGVTTSLNEFKARFQEMVEEHDKETEIFKQSVQELEATFTHATKTHELLTIQDQVTGRVEQYMSVIRTSIRKFRHDLDDMLSNLRNSNARFRKTFKVFSEGGNFSTDEVEEYRKKLERMATKIDSSEGSFMAELEGMETKRLEASTDYAGKLEDRFKHHLFDLTFMEKVTRWLTNTQVKIKSEVAFSNSQAKRLAVYLATFERHIDAVERPNLDKEQVTARDVQASLIPMLQTFHERSLYLHCLLNPATPSLLVLQTGLKSSGAAKNADNKHDGDGAATDRAALKDSGVEEACEGGVDSAALSAGFHLSGSSKTLQSLHSSSDETSNSVERGKKSKKRIKMVSGADPEDNGKPNTTPYSSRAAKVTAEDGNRPKTVPSETKVALKRSGSGSDKQSRQRSAGSRRASATKREQQGPRYDRKFLAFGDKMEDEKHFMARIRNVLRAGLEGLLATAEMFYRQKGQRSPTRPQAIHESFELCAEALVQRLVGYRSQAEDYHNCCIQELRGQLQKFALALGHLPPLVVDVTVREHVTELQKERGKSEEDYQARLQELDRRKTLHQSQLRPSLGHPHNRDELGTLCTSEEKRRKEALEGAKEHAELLGALEAQSAEAFIEKLSQTCETMLLQFDAVLTLEDVEVGKVEAKPKSTRRLLREKLTGAEEETDKLAPFPSEGATWEGLPTNELVLEENMEKKIRTPSIKTVKTTQGHLAVIKSRDRAYEDYKEKFYARLSTIREAMNVRILNEEKWTRSWKRSIAKIKELY